MLSKVLILIISFLPIVAIGATERDLARLVLTRAQAVASDGQTQTQARILAHPEVKVLPSKQKRWALIIGIDEYENEVAGLKGAVNDAKALKEVLIKQAGFPENQVVLLTTDATNVKQLPNRNNIIVELDNLSSKVPEDGLLLFSFSGHGVSLGNDAYLIPSDGRITRNLKYLRDFSIDVQRVKEAILESKVKQVLMLLDACRNEPGRGGIETPLTEAYKGGFSFDVANSGVEAFATLYATSLGHSAFEFLDNDTKQYRGYFNFAVVEGLKGKAANPRGEVTLSGLTAFVEKNVPEQARSNKKDQKPSKEIAGYKESELVLAVVNPDVVLLAVPSEPRTDLLSSPVKNNARSVLLDDENLELLVRASGLENEYIDPITEKLKAMGLIVKNSASLQPRDRAQLRGYFSEPSRSRDKNGLRWLSQALVIRISGYTVDLDQQLTSRYAAEASIRLTVYRTDTAEQVERYSDYRNKARGYGETEELARRNALRFAAQRIPDSFINSLVDKAKTVPVIPMAASSQPVPAGVVPGESRISKSRKILLHGPEISIMTRIDSVDDDSGKEEELRQEFTAPLSKALTDQGLIVEDSVNMTERDRAQLEGDLNGFRVLTDRLENKGREKNRLRWLPYALIFKIYVFMDEPEDDGFTAIGKGTPQKVRVRLTIFVYETENEETVASYSNFNNATYGHGSHKSEARRNALRSASQMIPTAFIKDIVNRAK